ncbi:MAG: tRNA pseudouridine synthase B [Acidimicrobiales bacterium]|nr:MAG: tRNA pseudouridine(55) synthase TruB [Actinomycetota bacterium]MBV6509171.1 tRNA pseudouridine synthase B [Acidimicrobiales bacterium]RIK08483.1 MAG: tRNA pseudouridine(55) synthase TruB [Acidobacteriota bacterium]
MNRTGAELDPGDGIAVVDKEAGWTSHDVVARARKILGTRKVGHAGTLDPDATGVLVLGVGRGTRLLRFIGELSKNYQGVVVLGVETSTLDATGEIVATQDMSQVTLGDVRRVAARLVGNIEQTPPMVSAVKVGGRRLYELARRGEEVERKPRQVTVHRLDVEATADPMRYRIAVECSSGTYVRSIAADIGHGLGGLAHLTDLRRTAIGPFEAKGASNVEDLRLLPPSAAVGHLASVTVPDEVAQRVVHGAVLGRTGSRFAGDGPWAVLAEDGCLLAVYEAVDSTTAKPAVVVSGATSG